MTVKQAHKGAGPIRPQPHRRRLWVLLLLLLLAFLVLAFRLLALAIAAHQTPLEAAAPREGQQASKGREVWQSRPEILDRKGRLVAGDIPAASLYAEPRHIVDVDDMVDRLAEVLPDLDTARLLKALRGRKSFVWVHRELTPEQQARVHALGLPGLKFSTRPRRVYPHGPLAAHVVGYVDIDNRGRAGIEAWLEKQGRQTGPVYLSIDLAAQHVLRQELLAARKTLRAKAAAGVVLDIHTGEVLAAVSLPDFDPNRPGGALAPDRLDRLSRGVYELGSVFKAFTAALVLELGLVMPKEQVDVATPLRFGRFMVRDHHGGGRADADGRLDVAEIFVRSSNVGAGRLALRAGAGLQRAFLERFGLLAPMATELGPMAAPLLPARWGPLETVTISYGHGLAVAPLQFVAASAALFNGGHRITPGFLRQKGKDTSTRNGPGQLIRPEVGASLRAFMAENVRRGTGVAAQVEGIAIGGKTGTAEKLVNGRYDKTRLRTSFLSIFPAEAPRFIMLVMLDEPKRADGGTRNGTAAHNAAPVSGRIIRRIAPILGLAPRLAHQPPFDEQLASHY